MKKLMFWLCGVLSAGIFFSCAPARSGDFQIQDTLSISLLRNGTAFYFSIPFSYIGDYQIQNFEFDTGTVVIGEYTIPLRRDELNISVFLTTVSDEYGKIEKPLDAIYLEDNGKILLSKMNAPLPVKNGGDTSLNNYCMHMLRFLKDSEMKQITDEYMKGNRNSRLHFEYRITINDEEIKSGMSDDFVLAPFWYN